MNKTIITFLTFLITLLLIFSITFTSFAYVPSFTFYLDEIYQTGINNQNTSVTRSSLGGKSCTRVFDSVATGLIQEFYTLPNSLIAGQTYIIEFQIARQAGVNADTYFYLKNNTNTDIEQNNSFANFYLAEKSTPNSQWSQTVEVSFTYNNEKYLFISFVATSGNNSGQFIAYFSQFKCYLYNPNAAVESQLDEQNSLQNEANSLQDEANSLADEGNSLAAEQNSKLFDNAVTYTIPDIDLVEEYTDFNNGFDDILQGATFALSDNHLKDGLRFMSFFFTSLWDGWGSDELGASIINLMYVSILVSLFLLIVGRVNIRLSDGDSRYSPKAAETTEHNSMSWLVPKDYR